MIGLFRIPLRRRHFAAALPAVLVVLASLLVPAQADAAGRLADSFGSTGDEIEGWFWLRDGSLDHKAEYVFGNVPRGRDLVLEITALATDRASGGRGFAARFELVYGFPASGRPGGAFEAVHVNLPNVAAADDPLGYLTRGTVVLPAASVARVLPASGTLYLRITRVDANGPHVAFNQASIVLAVQGERSEAGPAQPPVAAPPSLPETQGAADTAALQPGSGTGHLDHTAGDDQDWYSLQVERGEIIHIALAMPPGLGGSARLVSPAGTLRREVFVHQGMQGEIDHAATESGSWGLQILRSYGAGNYRLDFARRSQDDAGSGTDAGPDADAALILDDGSHTGQLPAGDDEDWYRIAIEAGEILTLVAVSPGSERLGADLRSPAGSVRRSLSIPPGQSARLDYAADTPGEWLIRVHRISGAGPYTLTLSRDIQSDGGGYGDASATIENAATIEPGSQFGQLLPSDDRDRYRIAAERGDILELTVNSTTETLRLALALLSAGGSQRAGLGVMPFASETVRYAATSAGDWFADVRRLGGAGPYGIRAEVLQQNDAGNGRDAGPCAEEPGDLSVPVSNGQLLPGDAADCYTISLDAHQRLSAALTTDGHLGAFMTLRTSGGIAYGAQPDAGGIPRIDIERDRPTDLRLVVTRRTGDGRYRLDVVLTPPRDGPVVGPSGGPGGPAEPGGPGEGGGEPDGGEADATPPITVAVGDEGRQLVASAPFQVEPGSERDPDHDGLDQTWEDAVMNAASPLLQLDDEEDWLARRPGHHAVEFVRITPFPESGPPTRVLVYFVMAWTRDYGRFATGIPEWDEHVAIRHNGDLERAILAFDIVGDTLVLGAAFTSAHGSDTDHSGVWLASGSTCNDGKVMLGVDQSICSALQFSSGRLLLQISEDKHAIYPSPDACEAVRLVMQLNLPIVGNTGFGEDCGGGEQLVLPVYNVGEPGHPLEVDIAAAFPGEQVWGGDGFCGGRGSTYDSELPCVGSIEAAVTGLSPKLFTWLNGGGIPQATTLQQEIEGLLQNLESVLPDIDLSGLPDTPGLPDILPSVIEDLLPF